MLGTGSIAVSAQPKLATCTDTAAVSRACALSRVYGHGPTKGPRTYVAPPGELWGFLNFCPVHTYAGRQIRVNVDVRRSTKKVWAALNS